LIIAHWLAAVLLTPLVACDREVTLVEPPVFFEFDPANTWPQCNTPPGAPPAQHIPPPAGIQAQVCPNPAPAGTRQMLFRLTMQIDVRVNLAIVDDRGRIVRELLVDANLGTDIPREIPWEITSVPPGNYRAHLRAGSLESNTDLRIEP
jgi:hypothetical protein